MLTQDLHADGALAGDHFRVVEGMDEGQLLGLFEFQRMGVGIIVGIAEQHHFAAKSPDRFDLDPGGRGRHDDDRPAAHLGRRQRDALRMVAG
jgi:hypothetical protein